MNDVVEDYIGKWAETHQEALDMIGDAFIAVSSVDDSIVFSSPSGDELENFLKSFSGDMEKLFVVHTCVLRAGFNPRSYVRWE